MIRLNLRLDYLGAEGLPVGTVRHDPGVPPELEALAVRVCREVYHDNEAAVSRMIDDLKGIPVKHHAKIGEHFRALLAAKVQGSSLVTCGACSHAVASNHLAIVRCGVGEVSGTIAGDWWATDRHGCGQFKPKAHQSIRYANGTQSGTQK